MPYNTAEGIGVSEKQSLNSDERHNNVDMSRGGLLTIPNAFRFEGSFGHRGTSTQNLRTNECHTLRPGTPLHALQ